MRVARRVYAYLRGLYGPFEIIAIYTRERRTSFENGTTRVRMQYGAQSWVLSRRCAIRWRKVEPKHTCRPAKQRSSDMRVTPRRCIHVRARTTAVCGSRGRGNEMFNAAEKMRQMRYVGVSLRASMYKRRQLAIPTPTFEQIVHASRRMAHARSSNARCRHGVHCIAS